MNGQNASSAMVQNDMEALHRTTLPNMEDLMNSNNQEIINCGRLSLTKFFKWKRIKNGSRRT